MDAVNQLSQYISRSVDFLREIGLRVDHVDSPVHGFVPGVRVLSVGLEVGPNATIDSLLHEAGHLACTPKPFRSWMNGNLARGQRLMFQALHSAPLEPEDPIIRAALQCSDPEATAWAFAAGRHLGIPDDVIIEDGSYEGDGALVRHMLASNAYAGINGLSHAGLCARGLLAKYRNQPAFPQMLAWLQDGPFPSWDAHAASLLAVIPEPIGPKPPRMR
jgi:hypothetical protein